MKKIRRIILFTFLIGVVGSCCGKKNSLAKEVTPKVMKAVMPPMVKTLFEHLDKEGSAKTVPFCNTFAPAYGKEKHQELASTLAKEYNIRKISFKRVTQKPRNPNNMASPKQMSILEKWKKHQAEGKELQPDFYREGSSYIGVMPILLFSEKCLACHGDSEKIEPDTLKKIQELYPEDKATGYKMNDIRGAFVVTLDV